MSKEPYTQLDDPQLPHPNNQQIQDAKELKELLDVFNYFEIVPSVLAGGNAAGYTGEYVTKWGLNTVSTVLSKAALGAVGFAGFSLLAGLAFEYYKHKNLPQDVNWEQIAPDDNELKTFVANHYKDILIGGAKFYAVAFLAFGSFLGLSTIGEQICHNTASKVIWDISTVLAVTGIFKFLTWLFDIPLTNEKLLQIGLSLAGFVVGGVWLEARPSESEFLRVQQTACTAAAATLLAKPLIWAGKCTLFRNSSSEENAPLLREMQNGNIDRIPGTPRFSNA